LEVKKDASKISNQHNQPNQTKTNQSHGKLRHNEPNFIAFETTSSVWRSLESISESEKIEILKRCFGLNQERKSSFQTYFEEIVKQTLFQFKRDRIK